MNVAGYGARVWGSMLVVACCTFAHEAPAFAQIEGGVADGTSGCPSFDAATDGQAPRFIDVRDWPAPTNAVQLAFSPGYDRLIVKNAASAVSVVNAATGASAPYLATYQFRDMSLSPDGRYAFVADYGGENIGYGTPSRQSYVHRVDFLDGSWSVRKAYIAGNVQATSGESLILKSVDQWVSFTNNAWGAGDTLVQLNTGSGSSPGYFATVYFGDFRYDPRTARLIHGNSGLSSQEIQAFKIVGGNFVVQEGTGTYGSASNHGGSVALATDGSAFYYGRLSVDALDVTHTLRVFPEIIYAATGDIAFGQNNFYDAHTGAVLGTLGFAATAYGLNPNGSDFWVFDVVANLLRHFVPVGSCPGDASTASDGGGHDAQRDASSNDVSEAGASPDAIDAPPTVDGALDGVSVDVTSHDAITVDVLADTSLPDAPTRDASTDAENPRDAAIDGRNTDAPSSLDAAVSTDGPVTDAPFADRSTTVDAGAPDVGSGADASSSRDGSVLADASDAGASDAGASDVDAGAGDDAGGGGCACTVPGANRAASSRFAVVILFALAYAWRRRTTRRNSAW